MEIEFTNLCPLKLYLKYKSQFFINIFHLFTHYPQPAATVVHRSDRKPDFIFISCNITAVVTFVHHLRPLRSASFPFHVGSIFVMKMKLVYNVRPRHAGLPVFPSYRLKSVFFSFLLVVDGHFSLSIERAHRWCAQQQPER